MDDAGGGWGQQSRGCFDAHQTDIELIDRLRCALRLQKEQSIPEEIGDKLVEMVAKEEKHATAFKPDPLSTGYPGTNSSIAESN